MTKHHWTGSHSEYINTLPLIHHISAKWSVINHTHDAAKKTVAGVPIPPAFLGACCQMCENTRNSGLTIGQTVSFCSNTNEGTCSSISNSQLMWRTIKSSLMPGCRTQFKLQSHGNPSMVSRKLRLDKQLSMYPSDVSFLLILENSAASSWLLWFP